MKRWTLLQSLPRATAPAAIGSLVSLAAQGFLALVLFRLFSPEEVGVFSATSQLAFFWASLALAHWVHPGFLWLTAFAGANMLQASFTGFCPAALVFKKLGVRPGASFK